MKARINVETKAVIETTIVLTEVEVRALDALVGYGVNPFLEVFYKKLGKHYMEPYESGVRTLFKCVNEKIRPELHRIDKIRKKLEELK